jgi:hypothetical protein
MINTYSVWTNNLGDREIRVGEDTYHYPKQSYKEYTQKIAELERTGYTLYTPPPYVQQDAKLVPALFKDLTTINLTHSS